MTLPQPGQWVRVWHACPGVDDKHREPVPVTHVVEALNGWRIATTRCDGRVMNVYADRRGKPEFGDEWEVVE